MAIWNGFWSGMDQVFDWCGSSYSWLQVAGMTSKSSAALGFAMAVRCCRFLIGGSLWSAVCNGCWVFCLTGLTSKGGMEGYGPGWCQFDQTNSPWSVFCMNYGVFGINNSLLVAIWTLCFYLDWWHLNLMRFYLVSTIWMAQWWQQGWFAFSACNNMWIWCEKWCFWMVV